jgi:hypothetical protein
MPSATSFQYIISSDSGSLDKPSNEMIDAERSALGRLSCLSDDEVAAAGGG